MKQLRNRYLLSTLVVGLLLTLQLAAPVHHALAGPATGSIIFENIVESVNNDRTIFTIFYGLGTALDGGGCEYDGGPSLITIANRQNVPVNGLQPGRYCISQDPGDRHLWTLVLCFTVGQNTYVPIEDSMIQLDAGMRVRCTFTNAPLPTTT
jgi:hypothetical protein